MIPEPDSVTRKVPVLVPLNFNENAPLSSVDTVLVDVATEIPDSRRPPLVAVTVPANSETTGGGGVGGVGAGGGDEGVEGEEEPHAQTK